MLNSFSTTVTRLPEVPQDVSEQVIVTVETSNSPGIFPRSPPIIPPSSPRILERAARSSFASVSTGTVIFDGPPTKLNTIPTSLLTRLRRTGSKLVVPLAPTVTFIVPLGLDRQTFACKKNFTNFFFNLLGVLGNLCEANMSNQDPRWTRNNGGHAHTDEHGCKHLHAHPSVCGRT